jgi:hypothetical protein
MKRKGTVKKMKNKKRTNRTKERKNNENRERNKEKNREKTKKTDEKKTLKTPVEKPALFREVGPAFCFTMNPTVSEWPAALPITMSLFLLFYVCINGTARYCRRFKQELLPYRYKQDIGFAAPSQVSW